MRKRYDFSKAKSNPYARRSKQQLTIQDSIQRNEPAKATAMWRPSELGEIIAQRSLKLRRNQSRASVVCVRFGRPTRAPNAGRTDPWWCPVLVTGLGRPRMTSIAGEDSLQALVLALQYVTRLLPYEAEQAGGTIEWLAETERPIFGDTAMLELYSNTVHVLFKEIDAAIRDLEQVSGDERTRRAVANRLKRAVRRTGFARKERPTETA